MMISEVRLIKMGSLQCMPTVLRFWFTEKSIRAVAFSVLFYGNKTFG